jgi:hypothetical protein
MASLSLADLLKEEADLTVKEINQDGSFKIERTRSDGTSYEANIDAKKFLAESYASRGEKVDLNTLPTTSPETPVKDSGLSFLQQIQFAESKTTKDKLNFLSQEFGSDNVKYSAADRVFRVRKDDGNWYVGDMSDGFKAVGADLLSQTLPIAASIKGGAMGAAAAAPVSPVAGPFAPLVVAGGAILGAGVGAMVGKAANIGIAHSMGIRTEADAEAISNELGKEFLYGAAGETAGIALKMTPRLLAKTTEKIKGNLLGPRAKQNLAQTLSSFNKLEVADNLMMIEKGREVLPHQEKYLKWLDTPEASRGVNPVYDEMKNIVQTSVEKAKKGIYKEYGDALEPIKPLLKHTKLSNDTIFANRKAMMDIVNVYNDAGLIDTTTKEFLPKVDTELAKVISNSSRNKLKEVLNIAKKATRDENTLEDLAVFIRNVDEVLEVGRPGSRFEIVDEARKRIVQVRSTLENLLEDNLRKVNPRRAEDYVALRKKYAAQRNYLDNVLGKVDDDKIQKTMQMLASEDGNQEFKQALRSTLKDGGVNADQVFNELALRRTAINTAPLYSSTSSGMGSLFEKVFTPVTSPRVSSKMAAKLSPKGLVDLQAKAKASNLLKTLSSDDKVRLFNNPDLYRSFMQPLVQSADLYEQQEQELINQGTQFIKQGR